MEKMIRTRKLLSQEEIENIESLAYDILENIGIRVTNRKLLEALSSYDDVKIIDNRAYINRSLVEKKIKQYRKDQKSINFWSKIENVETEHIIRKQKNGFKYPHKPTFVMSGHSTHIIDKDNGKIRPLTVNDCIEVTKFMDSLAATVAIRVGAPGNPDDVPIPLQSITRYKIGCEFSSQGGFVSPCENIKTGEYIYEMSKVMNKPFITSLYMGSPLRMEGNDLDKLMHFVDKKVPIAILTWPMIGVNIPITFPNSIAQALAEVYGGYTILRLYCPDTIMGFKVQMHSFDMKKGVLVYSTPEDCLLDTIISEFNKINGNVPSFPLDSTSKEVGIQAGVEKSSSALLAVLSEAGILSDIGQLATGELFSYEQAIYDCEILENVMRLVKGFSFDTYNIESIKNIVTKGKTFLDSDDTLERYKDVFWMPKIFNRSTVQQYLHEEKNKKDDIDEIIKKTILEYNFKLDNDKKIELDNIYKIAKRELIN